jgi:twitching motility protein PilI
VAETGHGALERTRRLLEAQRREAEAERDTLRALALSAREISILIPIGDVVELAVCENITPVPLTRQWVRGLTNVHGQLYTVVDLSVFLGGAETRLSRDARIIILGEGGLGSCLLVGNVTGLKVYTEEQLHRVPDDLPESVRGYFCNAVRLEDITWCVLDMRALSGDARYRNPSRVAVEPGLTGGGIEGE